MANLDLGPSEGMGLRVVSRDEVVNRRPQLRSARETGVGEGLPTQDAEPDLDLIEIWRRAWA